MTNEQLAEIEARATKATPGPWTAQDTIGAGWEIFAPVGLNEAVKLPFPAGETPINIAGMTPPQKVQIGYERWVQFEPEGWAEMQAANMALIAHARQDIPALITEVRRLRAERLTPEERAVVLGALDTELADELVDKDEFHRICAVRAKIEAARDGGKG